MSVYKKTLRYALLLVFDYSCSTPTTDAPHTLLSMDIDLNLAYTLCRERFDIPPRNITIVTDILPKRNVLNPWDPLSSDPKENPRIVRLKAPDITRICREIMQFVENTLRGIMEVTTKGEEETKEVFIYISGHGAQIPNPCRHSDNYEDKDNALIFTNAAGKERRYLRDDHIFQMLFGHMDVDSTGLVNIPITKRSTLKDKDGNIYYSYGDDVITIKLSSGVKDRFRELTLGEHPDEKDIIRRSITSPRKTYVKDRGLPLGTKMLMIIDTCHSGTMTDFHYIYDGKEMVLTRRPPTIFKGYPICICLAAVNDDQEAPSTTAGSPFTRYLYTIFSRLLGTVSIKEIYNLIYSRLPTILSRCRPTITATIDNADYLLPLLSGSPSKVDKFLTLDAKNLHKRRSSTGQLRNYTYEDFATTARPPLPRE